MKKPETSKVFLYLISILSILLVLFSLYQMNKLENSDALPYLIPAVFTELGAATAGYYWKSKNENRVKMILGAVKEISELEDLDENEVRIAEALIQTLN